jgi:hypothetical protein
MKRKKILSDIEKIYNSKADPLKKLNLAPIEKSRYLDFMSKIDGTNPHNNSNNTNTPIISGLTVKTRTNEPFNTLNLNNLNLIYNNPQSQKSNFVEKLKSKMKRSNTPKEFPGLTAKSIFQKSAITSSPNLNSLEKRSLSSGARKKDGEEIIIRKKNNFMENNPTFTVGNEINFKSIPNVGIQINNNINLIINANNEEIHLKKDALAEATSNLVTNKILIQRKNSKESFKVRSARKNNLKKNSLFGEENNESKKENVKIDKLMIFPMSFMGREQKL